MTFKKGERYENQNNYDILFKQSLKAMSDRAFEDCGRGNIQSVSNTNYSCFNKQLNQQNSNDFKAIEELALKTCKGAVKEISATGFVCE